MKKVLLILSLMMFVLSCNQTDFQSADNALSLLPDIEVNDAFNDYCYNLGDFPDD